MEFFISLDEVELEVDTFPEYITLGEVEVEEYANPLKIDLLKYYKYQNNYTQKVIRGE